MRVGYGLGGHAVGCGLEVWGWEQARFLKFLQVWGESGKNFNPCRTLIVQELSLRSFKRSEICTTLCFHHRPCGSQDS